MLLSPKKAYNNYKICNHFPPFTSIITQWSNIGDNSILKGCSDEKKLFLLVVFLASTGVSYADSWVGPTERLYVSENKQFAANVIPAKDNSPAIVKVF